MRDDPVKDAAQDVAEDMTQDVAEDVAGAAEDGSLKAFVVVRAIFQRRNCPTHAYRPPRCPRATRAGRARKRRGAERCRGRCGGRTTGRGAGLGLRGLGGARPPRHATTTAAVFVQPVLKYGRNWGQLSGI